MPPSRAAALGNGPDQLHADRIHLEVMRDANRPGKIAGRKPLAERRAQPVTGIRQHTAEAAHRPPSRDRSQRGRSLASYGQFGIRLERPLALSARGRPSNCLEEKAVRPTSPALHLVPASVIPASGNWRSCPALKHIAQRHPPSACPSSAPRCRRSPTPHRCRRPDGPLEPAVPSPVAPHPRHQQQQNDAADHSRPAQGAPPLAECSCVHQDRSALPRRADTSAAAPCDPSDPETASANVQARAANLTPCSSWSALQKPTTYESSKN